MNDLILYSFLIFLSWFIGKISDMHNEHWLNFLKKYSILFSITRWWIWSYIIIKNEILYIPLIALVFYWIYKIKFDYTNHVISLLVILFWIIYSNFWTNNNIIMIFILFCIYFFFDLIKQNKKYKKIWLFLILLLPILYSIYLQNILPISLIFFFFWVKFAIFSFRIEQSFFIKK